MTKKSSARKKSKPVTVRQPNVNVGREGDLSTIVLVLLPYLAIIPVLVLGHWIRDGAVQTASVMPPVSPLVVAPLPPGAGQSEISFALPPTAKDSSPPPLPVQPPPPPSQAEVQTRPIAIEAAPLLHALELHPTDEFAYCSSKPRDDVALQPSAGDHNSFGEALAAAALTQTHEFIVYNDAYQTLSYPMGDVSFLYGVCTDVVIRAYRKLGIDLQQLVHDSGLGLRDRNIDHRRTNTLRQFFERYAERLPITDNALDYRPGDIVTYFRPNNRGIRAHIAIVANQVGPSGAPMIIHNRGNGPELEDALFFDPITGHYRFTGITLPVAQSAH